MPKVSVVVAVYQVEEYIVRCLDSLRNQTLLDFEILLIDDGCLDKSGLICDDYSKKDTRFKVFHKKNEGVSSARQFGLEHAKGEYIIHVDPDDWVDPMMLEMLYVAAKTDNADLVICDYFSDSDSDSSYVKQEPDLLTTNGYFKGLLFSLYGACWNKLVRRSCFSKYDISFPKGLCVWEDKYVNLRLAENPIKITYLPKAFYHYVSRSTSAVKNHSKDRVYSIIYVINWLEKREHLCSRSDILNLKKFAKRDAFITDSISSIEFCAIYPEVDNDFSFKFFEIFRSIDFYVLFGIKYSLRISRSIYHMKKNISKLIRMIWPK